MGHLFLGAAALTISGALVLYLSVIAFQLVSPILAKLLTGVPVADFSFPGLFQNLGIVSGLAGATFRSLDLLTISVLLIALAMVVKGRNSPELQRTLEIPLLVSGLLALGSIGLVRVVA